MSALQRFRFIANGDDPRPLTWPLPHPYWVTGYTVGGATVVAYGESADYIRKCWPEAQHIEGACSAAYVFTSRFPRPEWWHDTGAYPVQELSE